MACYIFLPAPSFALPLSPPPLIRHIPPPDVHTITFHDDTIYVTVAKHAAHIHHWISNIRRLHHGSPHKLIVGLDAEWRPNMNAGEDHPIATLQLCAGHHCLVVQLLHIDCIPPSLHAFLADPRHIFCGVGVEEDVKKLQDHHGLSVRCVADLNGLGKRASGEDMSGYRHMGLKKLTMAVLGKEMKKPLHVTLSEWDNYELDLDQIEYAAIDAFASFEIAFTLYTCLYF